MAGHEWEDWFEREEFIGQISDIRVQNLQVEREVVQKRTFTRWMNLHLEKCDPPMEVQDLFRDIQDGRILMALLEELSGCKLLNGFKKSSHRIFRLNNIAKVLSFLEERNVKLVSIDATDVADGNSSIILGLIWNIILFFQIKELTGNIKSQFPSSSSLSSIPTSSDSDTSHSSSTPSDERRPASVAMRDQGKAIKKLLQWVQKRTRKFGVAVHDFSKSWTSGLAFLAVIKSIDPSLVDMRRALLRSARENLEEAFRTAHYSLGIPRLLDPEDVTINPPDEQSIMIYVSQFLEHFPGIEEPEEPQQVIERSISMGRLSSHDSDSDQIRNGIHRSRLRERPYVVHKDWVQPPPKIFISSVSEDRGLKSPTSPLAVARSWASEDSSIGSTLGEDRPTGVGGDPQGSGKEVFIISTSNSPQPSYVDSLISSESVIDDSAIGSPDSWVGSEAGTTPERFVESQSNGSLCDSGMAWDASVPCATPEEDAALDQGLPSSLLDKSQDEQLFIDEGIYSLSSLESTQERIQAQAEKEEEANRYILDLSQDGASKHVPDQKEVENKAEKDSEQMDTSPLQMDQVSTEQWPSLGLSEAPLQSDSEDAHSPEPKGTDQSQPSSHPMDRIEERTDRELECAKEATELCRDSQLHEQQLNVETESVNARNISEEMVCRSKDSLSEKKGEEAGILKEEVLERSKLQNEMSQGVLNGHADPQDNTATQISEALANLHPEYSVAVDRPPTNQGVPSKFESLDSSTNLSAPQSQTFVPSDPPERGDERTRGPEKEGQAGDEDPGLTGSSGSQESQIDVISPENPNKMRHNSGEPEDMSNLCLSGGTFAEKAHQIDSKQKRETENGHLGGMNQCDTAGSSNTDSPRSEAVDQTDSHTLDGTDQPNGQFHNKPCSKAPDDEVTDPQQNRSKPVDTWTNGEKGTTGCTPASEPITDIYLYYRDIDRSSPSEDLVSEPLAPMDLFYPDKEESMFTEPPEETEMECKTSVYSVSALQPAPPSEPLPEIYHVVQETSTRELTETHTPEELGEDFQSGVDLFTQEKEIKKNHHHPGTPSAPQERCLLPGGKEEMAGDWGVTAIDPPESQGPAEHSDLSGLHGETQRAAKENIEAMRAEARSAKSTDGSLVTSVLHHRKVAGSTESKDNRTIVSTSKTQSNNSDLGRREREELYLLLLLWLLLYCLWLLPQMDLSSLPGLLFNLDH